MTTPSEPIVVSRARRTWLLAALAVTACAPDDTVNGPCGAQPCAADAGTDADGTADGADTAVVHKVDFSVQTKLGKVLDTATTATIEPDADLYAEQGVQIDVNVVTENVPNGTTVQALIEGSVVAFGNVQNNAATIAKVTLECSQVARAISVVAKLPAGDVASLAKTLRLDCSKGCVAKIERIDAQSACETADVDPALAGFQANFRVSTASVGCTHASVKGTDTEGKAIEQTNKVALVGGTLAIVKVTLAPTAADLDGKSATVQGVVEDLDHPERPPTPSEPLQVKVATKQPEIAILQPPKDKKNTFSLADDTDKNKPGIQTTVVGTVTTLSTADKDAIKPKLDGKDLPPATLEIDGTFKIDLDFPASGAYTLQITAQNGCGLQSPLFSTTFTAFAGQGKMAIVEPANGAVLPAKLDAVPGTALVYDTQFVVGFQKAPDVGTEVAIYCRKSGPNSAFPTTSAGKATFKDATATSLAIAVTLDVESFGTSQTCIAKDNAPNPSLTEKAVDLTVALPAPCLKVAVPAADVTVTTGTLDAVLVAQNLEGRDVKAVIAVKGGGAYPEIDLGKVKGGVMNAAIKLESGKPPEALPDATYTISFESIDALGNLASEQVIPGCSDTVRTFTVDTKGPVIAFTLPAKATLTATDDPDGDLVLPGYQITVEVAVPAGDAANVCLSVAGSKVACKTPAAGATKVTFASVSLQPGTNLLEAVATDAAGNTGNKATMSVTLISSAPVVKFVTPAGSLTTATDKLAFQVKVVGGSGAPLVGAKIEVLIDGSAKVVAVTDNDDGSYGFELSGLLAAPKTTVQVGASAAADPKNAGFSPILVVSSKVSKPAVTIAQPADGAKINLESSLCVAGVPDCVATVKLTTTDVEDGSAATLTVDCGGKKADLAGSVASGAALFAGVVLANGKTCTLGASVTDSAGQQATANTVSVQVDRTAPVLGDLTLPVKLGATVVLIASDDVDQAKPGMQVNLAIAGSGLPKGSAVQLDVFDDDGKKAVTATGKVDADIPDNQVKIIDFGQLSLPDGFKIKMVFATADDFGNKATRTIAAQVFSTAPDVRITQPPYVEDKACKANSECGSAGVCSAGKCATAMGLSVPKNMQVFVVGIPVGSKLRACGIGPGLAGEACKESGYKVISEVLLDTTQATLDLSGLADGAYELTAEAETPISGKVEKTWTSSLVAFAPSLRKRSVVIDTVKPTLGAVTGPTVPPGVDKACLNDAMQAQSDFGKAGGSFTFTTTTTSEEVTVEILADGIVVASGATANKTVAVAVPLTKEGSVAIAARAIDGVGNKGDVVAVGTFTVNTVLPAGAFSKPKKSPILAADSLDVEFVADPGSTDLEGATVVLKDVGVQKASEKFSQGVAGFAHAKYGILGDGQHQLTVEFADSCGNAAVAATVPATILVDTKPPVPTFTAPAAGATFADKDDAAAGQSGYQVATTFGVQDGATWKLELGSECDGAFANCKGFAQVANGTVTQPGGQEPQVLVTVPFGSTPNYSLRLTGTDAAGNPATVQRGFAVKLTGCLVTMKGLPVGGLYTAAQCATAGQDCATVAAKLSVEFVGPCGTVTSVQLLKDGKELAAKAPTGAAAAFDVTVPHGSKFTLEGVLAGSKNSTGALTVEADLVNPKATFLSGTVLGTAVPAGPTAASGKPADLDANKAGHQMHLLLQLTDAGLKGGKLVSLERKVGTDAATALDQASLKLPLAIDATAATLEVLSATLQENAANTVIATVQDALGNIGTGQIAITVDWVAPSAPVLAAFTAADLKARLPSARLTFTAVGDNGATGTAASYDVRYSRKAIANDADFKAACEAKALPFAKIPKPAASGASEQVLVDGPDPRDPANPCKFAPLTDNGASTWFFAVQALDAAGNRSPVSNVLSTTDLRLRFAKLVYSGATDLQILRTRRWGAADYNGDGKSDLVMGGGTTEPLCVIHGRAGDASGVLADVKVDGTAGANYQCFTNTAGMNSVIDAGDLTGDGVADLVVGTGTGANPRSVQVFVGVKGGMLSTTAAVTISNVPATAAFGVNRVNVIRNFNGDLAGQNPVNDLAIYGPATGSITTDRVYVVPGSTAWSTSKPVTINLNDPASRAAANVLTIRRLENGAALFGGNVSAAGNVLADAGATQYDDLFMSQGISPSQAFVVRGRPLNGDTEITLSSDQSGKGSEDAAAVRLSGDPNFMSSIAGFATSMVDVIEFDGKPEADLAIQHQATAGTPPEGLLYFVSGAEIAKSVGKLLHFSNTGAVAGLPKVNSNLAGGFTVRDYLAGLRAIGNFSGRPDGGIDLVHARGYFAPGGSTYVAVRVATPRPELGGKSAMPYVDVLIQDVFAPGSTTFGSSTAGTVFAQSVGPAGDFNGDGKIDLFVSAADTKQGSTTVPGTAMIVY